MKQNFLSQMMALLEGDPCKIALMFIFQSSLIVVRTTLIQNPWLLHWIDEKYFPLPQITTNFMAFIIWTVSLKKHLEIGG